MPSLAEAHSSNSSFCPDYIPVAVFVGGTGGIAASVAELLARYTEGRIHIIIAGRNRLDGIKILESLVTPLAYDDSDNNFGSDYREILREFVFCDASNLASVRTASLNISAILRRQGHRINFLLFSAGYANLFKSVDTMDALDLQLMMRYYHRFKMIFELMPLLRNARDLGQDAKVLSILGSGVKWPVNSNDFGYKNLGVLGRFFKALMTGAASAVYMDIMIEEFASRERGISFTHVYPGLVKTAQLDFSFRSHWLFAPFEPFFDLLINTVTLAVEESGEWTLFSLLNANAEEKGFYRRGYHGQELDVGDTNGHTRKSLRGRLYTHSVSETNAEELPI